MAKKIAKSASKSASKSAGKPASKPVSKPAGRPLAGKSVGKKAPVKVAKPVAARAAAAAKRPGKVPAGGAKVAVKAAAAGKSRAPVAMPKAAARKVPAKATGKPAVGLGKAKSGLAAAVSKAVTVAPAGNKAITSTKPQGPQTPQTPQAPEATQGPKLSKAAGRPGSKWERPSLKRTPAQQAAMTASKGRLDQQREVARAFAVDVARLLGDLRCENVVILDWSRYSSTSDYVVVATGTSDRQMRTCGDEVSKMAETTRHGLPRVESDDRATWVLCDASDVVAHIFEPNTRAHYDMEGIYPDAPRVDWQR